MPDRTTVVLPPLLKQRAVEKAREQGISFAEFVRRAVEEMLRTPRCGAGKRKTDDPFWDNLEVFEGGPEDAAARHDQYLYGGKR